MRSWRARSLAETRAVGRELAGELAPDGVLLLQGDLGAGKTVLAQGVAEGLGIPAEEVQSPTYTLVREHHGAGGRLLHIDLYRLEPEETAALGVEELLAGPGVKVVEWAERLPSHPPRAVWLALQRVGESEERQIDEIEPTRGAPPGA